MIAVTALKSRELPAQDNWQIGENLAIFIWLSNYCYIDSQPEGQHKELSI